MGTSVAFLTELAAQRSTALRDLRAAQAVGDDGAAAVALARIEDLDELLSRNDLAGVRLDLDAAAVDSADPALDTLTA